MKKSTLSVPLMSHSLTQKEIENLASEDYSLFCAQGYLLKELECGKVIQYV